MNSPTTHAAGQSFISARYSDISKEAIEKEMVDLKNLSESILAKADDESRDLTAAENARVSEILNQFKEAEAALVSCQSQGRQALPNDLHNALTPIESTQLKATIRRDINDKSWAGLFGRKAMNNQGWKSGEDFYSTIAHGLHHPNLMNATMTEGVDADGGYVVPEYLLSDLMDGSLEREIIRPLATVFPMQSNQMSIAGVNTQDHSTTIGGLAGVWLAEGGTATPQKALFRKIALQADKLAIFTQASNELVQDGLSFEEQLSTAMSQAISYDLDYSFLNGTGTGQPQGILNAASKITVAKETSQVADTIVYENIVKMWSRLHPGLVNDAVWIANSNTIPQLFSMSFEGASSSVPAFMPANGGLSGSPSATLMGRPILFTEKCPTLGDEGDIILCAPSQYAIGLRQEASIQRSMHEGWLTDATDWRLIIRVTGLPLWDSVVTPRTGSTLSWCVTLADRA